MSSTAYAQNGYTAHAQDHRFAKVGVLKAITKHTWKVEINPRLSVLHADQLEDDAMVNNLPAQCAHQLPLTSQNVVVPRVCQMETGQSAHLTPSGVHTESKHYLAWLGRHKFWQFDMLQDH